MLVVINKLQKEFKKEMNFLKEMKQQNKDMKKFKSNLEI